MEENADKTPFLLAQIQKLERERDQLQNDIEQLCMQQAGPSFLGVTSRMHFQRTSALEQDIETLNKKLAMCTRVNQNLQEELSEAYHVKSQLADLHGAEVSKNAEAEKQLQYFQNCVADAFAERDNAIMEAEKAKEQEEYASREMENYKKRIEELTHTYLEEKKLIDAMQIDQKMQEKQLESFKKVVDKFYAIRQQNMEIFEDTKWEDKCKHLLGDSSENWEFCDAEEASTRNYVSALEQEVETLRKSSDCLRNNLQVGLEIENHLKRRVSTLEKYRVLLQEKIEKGLSPLLDFRSKLRMEVMTLLKEGHSHLESTVTEVLEKVSQLESMAQQKSSDTQDIELHENDCRDVHINNDASMISSDQKDDPDLETTAMAEGRDASKDLAQALQEKVAVLLLLSQEEERHLLERNLNIALQKKIEELQRNLLQVTNEKVKILMELAQLKQEHQVLRENASERIAQGQASTAIGEKRTVQEKDGKLKNFLKKSYLRHWVVNSDSGIENADIQQNYEGNSNQRKSTNSEDFVRMRIENAAMNESVESMEHLTFSIRRLRVALLKANESGASVDDIIVEARLLKTALGSSLPLSWSSDCDVESQVDRFEEAISSSNADSSTVKIDFVSAAGLEMVELLIFAAQVLKERTARRRLGTYSVG